MTTTHAGPTAGPRQPITHPTIARLVLGVLAVALLGLGVYVLFFPADFYAEFPLGYAWLPPLGPYSSHLLRDYGSMNLGAGAGVVYAWVTLHPHALRAVGVVAAVGSIPHGIYHAAMWRMSGVGSATLQAGLLFALAVLGLVLIPLSRSPRPA